MPSMKHNISRRSRIAMQSSKTRLNESEEQRRRRLESNRIRNQRKYYETQGEKIKKKLLNARDSYIKYLMATNNGAAVNYLSRWQWPSQVEYLNRFLPFSNTVTCINKSDLPDNTKHSYLSTAKCEIKRSTTQHEIISPLDNIFNLQSMCPTEVQDEWESFFIGFYETVKAFTHERQAAVKMKIAEIIMENELEHLDELASMELHHISSNTLPHSSETLQCPIDNVKVKQEYNYEGKISEEDPLNDLENESQIPKVKTEPEELEVEFDPTDVDIEPAAILKTEPVEVKNESCVYDDNITIEECCIEQQFERNKSSPHGCNTEQQTKQCESSRVLSQADTEAVHQLQWALEQPDHTGSDTDEYKSNAPGPPTKAKLCTEIVIEKCVETYSRQDNESPRASPLQITGDIVIEHDNNQMEIDDENVNKDHVQKPTQIIGVRNKSAKSSAERGREFRARKALLKLQTKQQKPDAIVGIATQDIQNADPLEIRIIEKPAKCVSGHAQCRVP